MSRICNVSSALKSCPWHFGNSGIPAPPALRITLFTLIALLAAHAFDPGTVLAVEDGKPRRPNILWLVDENMKGGFATLNRYKEKCFMIKPLMRDGLRAGKLSGAARALMDPMPFESLYKELRTALDTWEVETGDRGDIPEPPDVVAPFEEEMHDWFGTPEWVKDDRP